LWPSGLAAIAVEGLSPIDQRQLPSTVEVADLCFYFGHGVTFERADATSIAQFKYSIAKKDDPYRASDAKETLAKFAEAFLDYRRNYGTGAVDKKLDFQLITNRPIYQPFVLALRGLASGTALSGEAARQAGQVRKATKLQGKPLAAFAGKLKLLGGTGSLPATKRELASQLVDWSATRDPIAAARLGQLKELVREKAGHKGSGQNLIHRTDILAALDISDPSELLPCPSAIADVGPVLEREQLQEAVDLVQSISAPLLVHAPGGIGKTVFLTSLASRLGHNHEVVFFDCFGGGSYRSPEDARHLPRKGLVHIANTLAFRGLCDPILPGSPDVDALLRTFRRRLLQTLETIGRGTPGRRLALFLDAIDNADFAARQSSEDCFPVKLLESLDAEPIPGLTLVVSCRSERKPSTHAKFHELELRPFSLSETTVFLFDRIHKLTRMEVNVAQARSRGNARVLAYLVLGGREMLHESEIQKHVVLDELLLRRITEAFDKATARGYRNAQVEAFLAGLAVLPPPVPVDEYASANGLERSAVLSFASDLFPLIECSNHGLMFKDEPTETLVQKKYGSSRIALKRLAKKLLERQTSSVYAARALPGLLHQIGDASGLFKLAFDDRIPTAVTSVVGKRNVRYARLKAATLNAAIRKDYNQLTQLLVELSSVAAVDLRGAKYILDNPDLVVAASDVDSKRRLFETRTGWPGTRHARLAIANALSGDGPKLAATQRPRTSGSVTIDEMRPRGNLRRAPRRKTLLRYRWYSFWRDARLRHHAISKLGSTGTHTKCPPD
jgi:hypothetical protein